MKLACALGMVFVGLVLSGCGSPRAKDPSDVFAKMDKELENAISTTTLTSDVIELPSERLTLAQWDEDESDAPAPVQTWGTPKPSTDPGAKP